MDSFGEIVDYKDVVQNDYAKAWTDSFRPNNEHRIFLTHWLGIGLFLLDGKRWDLLNEAAANAFLCAACGVALLACFARHFDNKQFALACIVTAFCFCFPFAYENILWGFQSQHYFFILFSLLGIGLLIQVDPGKPAWLAGLLSSIAACFCVGSGFYAALCVVLTSGLMLIRRTYRKPGVAATLFVSLVILIANIPFILTPPSSNQYRADSILQFVLAFFRHLAWPNVAANTAWLGPLMFVPFLWLLFGVMLRKQPAPRTSYAIIGLGFWTLIITLSLSYLRGRYTPYVRYYDYNCFHAIVCALSLIEVWRLGLVPAQKTTLFTVLASSWVTAVAIGGMHLLDFTINHRLPQRKRELRLEQAAVKKFIETHDIRSLEAPELSGIFPFTPAHALGLASDLQDQQVVDFLPPEMTPPSPEQKRKLPLLSQARVLLLRATYVLRWITIGAFALAISAALFSAKNKEGHRLPSR